ncbi:OmpA family protein [Rhodoblastus acidophilus]|uniref:OmpA family protein n=1 Tax=Candidatus Rhodoblastus alkanivorans TaxID=2954117 RepID=A0ABS9Z6P2_9HYPH|nr:OmpA family protein [Candidatus Rhodoblastus alkanivorans]MCI4683349.1 OmpA family protein [Candidatus Rhodoblastus alkanivorans]MDI4640662.1 OmpA family protein [Rhodoblastus acidophilus]
MSVPAQPDPGTQDATLRGAAEAGNQLGLLKRLLFRSEQSRLDAIQAQTEALAARLGDQAGLEAATAEILAGALRRAEVSGHRELSEALAPLVVTAIRSEIANSRDMMVEALYPITGRLVAAAVSNAFRELVENINARLNRLLSTRLWRLRLRSLLTGRPLAEILLEAAQRPRVRRILALERDSGRLLAHWPEDSAPDSADEIVSGMLAAISQFAAQAFACGHGELRTLDMGASRLLLRASARLIVAAEFFGEPRADDEARMDSALLSLISTSPGPPGEGALARIAADFVDAEPKKSGAARNVALAALALLLIGGAAYWPARNFLWERRLDDAFARAVAAQPGLADFPLKLTVDAGKKRAALTGLAPPAADLAALARAIDGAGTPYRLEMRIARVATPASVEAAARQNNKASGEAVAVLAGRLDRIQATVAEQQGRAEALSGQVARLEAAETAQRAAAATPAARLARLAAGTTLWFDDGTDFLEAETAHAQIAALAAEMKRSGLSLRVVGYTDSLGSTQKNMKLSQARAEAAVAALIAQGVDSSKLAAVGRGDESPIAAEHGSDSRRNRRVVFEVIGPAEQIP